MQDDPVRGTGRALGALDLLVVGSRSYGPADCVMLGEVSAALAAVAPDG